MEDMMLTGVTLDDDEELIQKEFSFLSQEHMNGKEGRAKRVYEKSVDCRHKRDTLRAQHVGHMDKCYHKLCRDMQLRKSTGRCFTSEVEEYYAMVEEAVANQEEMRYQLAEEQARIAAECEYAWQEHDLVERARACATELFAFFQTLSFEEILEACEAEMLFNRVRGKFNYDTPTAFSMFMGITKILARDRSE